MTTQAPHTKLIPALLLSLCTACGSLPPSLSPAPDAPNLLGYPERLRHRSQAELASELEQLNRQYTQQRNEENRLRLALFHALASSGDRARALALLDVPPNEQNGSGRNHPLAQLLIPLLQERARAIADEGNAQQRLRDETRRADQLQQKLDALREIEKKMLERPGSRP